MALQTRQPTGAAGWPMLLVEGVEGSRKTSESLRLSADPRIGHAYVIEVGELRVDEYATLGNFEVVEHDGSLRSIVAAIRDVMLLPPLEGRPTLLVIDSGTALWDLVKRQAELYARSSNESKRKIEADPNVEITVGHQAWNRAKDPWWWSWLNDMRAWPGILVMTGRAGEVSKFLNGQPVAGQKDYRVEIESGTPFVFDATVRMKGANGATVVTAKALKLMLKGIETPFDLPKDHPLAHLIFDVLEAGTEVVLDVARAKQTLLAQAKSLGWGDDDAKAAASEAWRLHGNRERFDHRAMSALIAALPVPDAAPPSTPDVEPDPESTPDVEPDVDTEGAVEAQEPAEQSESTETAAEADSDAQELDRTAFETAPPDVLSEVVAKVRDTSTGDVDMLLRLHKLPLTGNVQTRRARLAARLVRIEVAERAVAAT